MNIKLLVDGGAMKPGPTLAQKLGPLGLNINEVIKKSMMPLLILKD
jgi:ribosomal protein L11